MTILLKVSGLFVAGGLALTALAGAGDAKTAKGICQSASAKQATSCCQRYVKTKAGKKWLGSGGSCGRKYVKCEQVGVAANQCYYPPVSKTLPPPKETHDHQPPNTGNNSPTNGNTKP